MDTNSRSVLIGNGLDVQVGGEDYLNKWILIRLLAKAKMGKYDTLFMSNKDDVPIITGDEIVDMLQRLLEYANKARNKEFSDLVNDYGDPEIIKALDDFIDSHNEGDITSIEEIGMEDWLLIFLLFLLEQNDIFNQYPLVKQGIDRMILDAIYCEGEIQKLFSKMPTKSKEYFCNFDNVFTLNYDETIEKLTKRTVYHLHGDFKTLNCSENSHNALGYTRIKNGVNIQIPMQFRHCFSSAILDFSGNRKYKYATDMTNAFFEFEERKKIYKDNDIALDNALKNIPSEQREIICYGIKEDLQLGQNYFFREFENLYGTLTIIGLAPQNDSHIFECINRSNIENVIFYLFFGGRSKESVEKDKNRIKSQINKSLIIKNVDELWDELGISMPTRTSITISEKQLQLLNNKFIKKPIGLEKFSQQLSSIPKCTREIISKMMNYEIHKAEYQTSPESEKDLILQFRQLSEILRVSAVSPQIFFYLCIKELKSNSKNVIAGKKKRKKKKRS